MCSMRKQFCVAAAVSGATRLVFRCHMMIFNCTPRLKITVLYIHRCYMLHRHLDVDNPIPTRMRDFQPNHFVFLALKWLTADSSTYRNQMGSVRTRLWRWYTRQHRSVMHSNWEDKQCNCFSQPIFMHFWLHWFVIYVLFNLWSPYGIGRQYIFSCCGLFFFLLSFFFPRLISAAADWMSAILPHMVWP